MSASTAVRTAHTVTVDSAPALTGVVLYAAQCSCGSWLGRWVSPEEHQDAEDPDAAAEAAAGALGTAHAVAEAAKARRAARRRGETA